MNYWTNEYEHTLTWGAVFEIRAELALKLLTHFGVIAAKLDGEDSAGRSRMSLQEPRELVDRCFEIAELFVSKAEEKGLLKPQAVTLEEKATKIGQVRRLQMDAEFKQTTSTVND